MLWAATIHQSQLLCDWILPKTAAETKWLKAYKRGNDYPWPGAHLLYIYQQLDKTRIAIPHTTPEEFMEKYYSIKAERKQAALLEERKDWWVPNPDTRARPP